MKFYITTAIPYINAPPHMGQALEFVQTDVIARYHKLIGDEVCLLTGADENGMKIVKAAEENKKDVQGFADANAEMFREMIQKLNISVNEFERSSERYRDSHWPGVQRLWELAVKSGDIYKKTYTGLYCLSCELFYPEGELDKGMCPVHGEKAELVSEENYFFRLSKYQQRILDLLESDELRVLSHSRRNEVLSFVREGLDDFSVSRSMKRAKGWGIPVPGDRDQVIYVWFDALAIYLTGVGYGTNDGKFDKWWPANVHVIGKDIIRFHTVYWPAMLLSAGLPLPEIVHVHGYITVDGKKMSKTIGNVVDPVKLAEKYTADGLRYYLIKDIPTFEDGDFSEKALKDRMNKELLGDLGNLVNRVLTLVEKANADSFKGTNELEAKLDVEGITDLMDGLELHKALNMVMDFVRECNKYINDKKPWSLQGAELESVLYNLLESIRISSILLYPFIPDTAAKINEKLGTTLGTTEDCKFRGEFKGRVKKGGHLFEKIE